jgi:hypothetical protein
MASGKADSAQLCSATLRELQSSNHIDFSTSNNMSRLDKSSTYIPLYSVPACL